MDTYIQDNLFNHSADSGKSSARNRQIGQAIRRFRNANEVSANHLAAYLGITTETMSRMEWGMETLSAPQLWDIAAFFDLPFEAFFIDCAKGSESAGAGKFHQISSDIDYSASEIERPQGGLKSPAEQGENNSNAIKSDDKRHQHLQNAAQDQEELSIKISVRVAGSECDGQEMSQLMKDFIKQPKDVRRALIELLRLSDAE